MDDESRKAAQPAVAPADMDGETESTGPPSRAVGSEPSVDGDGQAVNPDDRYQRDIDLDSESTHARVVRLVGTGRRVLELGPASGHMSRVLRDQGCSVVGIEVDPEMASVASEYCERMIVGDLDTLDLDAELGPDRFDVIVAADVLEHLKDPRSSLRRLREFLSPEGFFVISLPNVAHGSVRLALLEGRFPYQRVGLLDETHLRFFTRESIDELLDESELGAAEIYRQQLNLDASEVPFDAGAVPAEVLQALNRDPDARTYQFVIKAIPFAAHGLREFQRRMRELAHENARLREAVNERHATFSSREGELRRTLVDLHDQLLRRDEELHQLQEELGDLRQAHDAESAAQRDQILRLRVRLDRLLNSPPARAYGMLRDLPGVRGLVARRTTGYETALRGAQGGPEPPHG
jgi:2-polyprenyl-3-methyl-5-hydroxy-6-metoxy-1,4-benzoquinol methylase